MSRHSLKRLITLVLATLSITFRGQALNNPPQPFRKFQSNSGKLRSHLAPKEYPSLRMTPALKLVATFLIGVASAAVFLNSNSQFQTVDDIPAQYFKEKKSISGQVKRVTDGDTFRVRHIPGPLSSADYKGNLKDHTLTVRLYAVDAPETAKLGNPGQPFGDTATKFVESKLLNKNITLKLLAKDRYGRALAVASYTENGLPFNKGKVMDISEELVKNGLAVVYRQGGAQYNGGIARWNALEDAAKKKKIGLWSQSAKSLQLPSDYKKKIAGGNEKDDKSTLKPSKRGIRRYAEASVSVGN